MMIRKKSSVTYSKPINGFTLFELIVVLGIISAMISVVLPFCKRSNTNLELKQTGNNIAQVLRYGINLAEKQNKRNRFVYCRDINSYHLEIITDEGGFEPVNGFTGRDRYIRDSINFYDIDGFEQVKDKYIIEFDPEKKFLDGMICFCSDNLIFKIIIEAKNVQTKFESILQQN